MLCPLLYVEDTLDLWWIQLFENVCINAITNAICISRNIGGVCLKFQVDHFLQLQDF